jgi:hypothetical protein
MAEALGFATEEIILFSAKTRHGRPQLWRAIKAACAEGDEG